jgi:glyoxylase-like metal-dependent hydrolase (beta-lactamase superfamily II)
MLKRRYLFPGVIEMNYQAMHRLGVNVYLVEDGGEWALIDIGYDDTVDEIIDLIRRMDFSLSGCKYLIATHADVDHTQGLAKAASILRAPILCHADCRSAMESADPELTFARIVAQEIDLPLKPVKVERTIAEGEKLAIGGRQLDVWSTPGHTRGQLAFKLDNLLFVGDNLYRDGSVGVIDAHHGSHLPDFIRSLQRILADDAEFWLPSHGPVFRRNEKLIRATIARLEGYQHLADFGTCAVDWPLLDEWEEEVRSGKLPDLGSKSNEKEEESAASGPARRKKGSRLPGALS